jgi:hypothetical protein
VNRREHKKYFATAIFIFYLGNMPDGNRKKKVTAKEIINENENLFILCIIAVNVDRLCDFCI